MSSRGNTRHAKGTSKEKKQTWKAGGRSNSSKSVPTKGTLSETSGHNGPSPAVVPLSLQQQLLNIFRDTFTDRFTEELPAQLQAVKQHLYNRDFSKAFGPTENLEAYAARWSPSRALAYCTIFADLSEYLVPLALSNAQEQQLSLSNLVSQTAGIDISKDSYPENPLNRADDAHGPSKTTEQRRRQRAPCLRISCLGGGAGAEVVGLAGYHRYFCEHYSDDGRPVPLSSAKRDVAEDTPDEEEPNLTNLQLQVKAIDIADWGSIIERLEKSITSPPKLSQYASAAARAAAVPLISNHGRSDDDEKRFRVAFKQQDLLIHSARPPTKSSSSSTSSTADPSSSSASQSQDAAQKPSEKKSTTTTPTPTAPGIDTSSSPGDTMPDKQEKGYSYPRAQAARFNFITQDAHLVTLMFTLNELYSASIPKATELLMTLTQNLSKGTLLLVVDSPGSYSTLSLAGVKSKTPGGDGGGGGGGSSGAGGAEADEKRKGSTDSNNSKDKVYPMKYLLDLTLLRGASGDEPHKGHFWEKLVSDDSRWFRLAGDATGDAGGPGTGGLKYPIQLENMRYQIHLYRRI